MTTERQKRANRLNALKSTGPRTEEGKKRSSENGRKHGLASALAKEDVGKWLCTIMGVDLNHLHVNDPDDRFFAALELAEAEATLERAQLFEEYQALVDHLGGPEPPPGETEIFEELVQQMESDLLTQDWSKEDWALCMGMLNLIEHARKERERDFERLTRLSRRYRREAESVRRAALKSWLGAHYSETNPISS